jgi:uncharacterized LabA/DUF88 family protein
MDRSAIFVDAGYVFAQGSILIAGTKLKRSETVLDEAKVLEFLKELAKQLTGGLPLLRLYWYDGTDSGPTPVHRSLAHRNDVKVRLGIVNSSGQQKGVDSLLVSDLIDLSRSRAMCDAVLLTGDEDLRIGVQKAQEVGVRVHLVGLEPSGQWNQSQLLQQEADTTHQLSKADVQGFLKRVTVPPVVVLPPPVAVAGTAGTSPLEALAEQFAKPDVDRVKAGGSSVPQDIDRLLLLEGATIAGSMTPDQKRLLRKTFIKVCKALP